MAAKSNGLRRALLASTSILAGSSLLAALPAAAQSVLPTQGLVTSGAASIRQSGADLSVTQTSQRAIVNWGSFSIGPANGVTFDQPSASSAILNRVTGSTTSTIAGQLQANGQVYLVNPNGIAITKTGAVQVGGGFVASTLGIADNDFNKGNLNFVGKGASAGVSNAGSIEAAPGGFVGLIGGTVSNSGVVSVPLGKVAMGSGEQATLNLTGDNFLQVAVPTNTKTADGQALVDVSGKVRAAGGSVQLKAATVAQAIRNAVNVPGELSVTSARASGGSIVLGGGPGGDVSVRGRLRASGRTAGGTIAIGGHDVALRQAKLAASSAKGRGGSLTVTGTHTVSLASSAVDASGATGGGAIRIGGDFHGASDLTSAQTTTIDSASTLNASATGSGDGGTVAVWSDATTNFAERITATGGPSGGNGGYVEVSANPATHGMLTYSGFADLTAPKGATGTLLLDPFDITISGGPDSGGSFSGGVYTPNPTPPATSVVSTTTLVTQLGGANVVVSTGLAGSPGTDAGNLTVSSPVTWASPNSLTLTAASGIFVNSNSAITATGGGSLALNGALVNILSPISTAGGGITVTGTTSLSANATTAGGSITFNNGVILNANVVINSGAGTTTFGGAVDSGATGFSSPCGAGCDLMVSGGVVNFDANVGSNTPLGGLTASGLVNLFGNVTTSGGGAITFQNAVALGADSTINAGAGTTTFGGTVDGGHVLTLSAANVFFLADVGSGTPLGGLAVSIVNPGASVFLGGNVTTNNANITFNGDVFLDKNVTLDAGAGTITFASTVDTDFSTSCAAGCDLTATASALSFGGAWGGINPLGAVSLTSTNGMTLPSIAANTIVAQTTGASADVTLEGFGATLSASAITMNSNGGRIVLGGAVDSTGSVALNAAGDIIEEIISGVSQGSISGATLGATSSAGRVVLTLSNTVPSVSGSAPAGFSFFNQGAFDVGSAGITSSSGSIALETVTGSITQTGPIRGLALFADAGSDGLGDVILNNPNNAVGALAGAASGSFQFANNAGAGLTIGPVNYFVSSATGVPDLSTSAGVSSFASTVPGSEIQVLTAGNLVVDSPVQGSIPDGLIVLAATGNFINNVGPGAVIDPWQIYSASPTGDVFNSLDSGNTAVWNTTFGQPVAAPGNRYVFAFQPTITVASGDLTKSYGQDVTSRVAADFTITGLQPGVAGAFLPDTAAAVYSGTPSVTSLGSPARASAAGNPYPITVAPGSFTVSDRYALVLDSSGRLTIDPLPLTYAVADARLDLRDDGDPRRRDAVRRASWRHRRSDRRRVLRDGPGRHRAAHSGRRLFRRGDSAL